MTFFFRQQKRAAGNRENYVYVDGNGYRCHTCWTSLKCAPVAHLVMNGTGNTNNDFDSHQYRYDMVLYCPACEEKPNFNGTPVFE